MIELPGKPFSFALGIVLEGAGDVRCPRMDPQHHKQIQEEKEDGKEVENGGYWSYNREVKMPFFPP